MIKMILIKRKKKLFLIKIQLLIKKKLVSDNESENKIKKKKFKIFKKFIKKTN